MATLTFSGLRDGPVQRTGTTSIRLQRATTVPSTVIALMCAVFRAAPLIMPDSQAVTFSVSLVTGRLSLMLEYLIRDGSCQTYPLLPPSSRCSMTTSQPRPSQLLNAPRLMLSISTVKHTLTAGSGCWF